MTSEHDSNARLREIKLDAAAEAMALSEEEVNGFILKEEGRLKYHLQEAIELIAAVEPLNPVAKSNVYTLNVKDGIAEYFTALSAITDGIYSTVHDPIFDGETKDKIQEHLARYAEVLTKLGGFLSGVSLNDVFEDPEAANQ